MTKGTLIFDTEVYQNYFLLAFRNVETQKITYFERYNDSEIDLDKIRRILQSYKIIGFNSINFDIPLIFCVLTGATNARIKECCDEIIVKGLKYWHIEQKFGFKISQKLDHIDLIEVAPGKASLKVYGGRLHSKKLQDMPLDPADLVNEELCEPIREYCINDLKTTEDLYRKLLPQIELREKMSKEYEQDLRSKSDAQIAEAVIKSQIEKRTGVKPVAPIVKGGAVLKYRKPDFIKFKTDIMKDVLKRFEDAEFVVSDGGKIVLPKGIDEKPVRYGNASYRLGIGGLHSTEENISYESDDEWMTADRDVSSFYPSIILVCGLYPEHIGKDFLILYKSIVRERLEAKKRGDKIMANVYKTICNGSFGKLASKWSSLFSPQLMLQVTITGQLSLLMLIEILEEACAEVISANTDGVVFRCLRKDKQFVDKSILVWESLTGFETEETLYKSIHCRDINNYIAIKYDGTYKVKGAYAPPEPVATSWPNPHGEVSTDAAIAYLKNGTGLKDTILACKDMRKFVTVRAVKGGAVKNDEYLGRAVRWYYAKGETGVIQYKLNGYTVARSEGARPCMELPEDIPKDLNYDWYINEAGSILQDIGAL